MGPSPSSPLSQFSLSRNYAVTFDDNFSAVIIRYLEGKQKNQTFKKENKIFSLFQKRVSNEILYIFESIW